MSAVVIGDMPNADDPDKIRVKSVPRGITQSLASGASVFVGIAVDIPDHRVIQFISPAGQRTRFVLSPDAYEALRQTMSDVEGNKDAILAVAEPTTHRIWLAVDLVVDDPAADEVRS